MDCQSGLLSDFVRYLLKYSMRGGEYSVPPPAEKAGVRLFFEKIDKVNTFNTLQFTNFNFIIGGQQQVIGMLYLKAEKLLNIDIVQILE